MNAIGIVRLMLTDGVITQEIAGKYFPELKESEDERIRKELIEFFTIEHWGGDAPFSAESAKERVAWLEKQGKQKQDPCEHCKDRCLNCHNFPCIKKRAFEQGKSVFEVINEEKVDNANKVEPKFKIGDIITNGKNIGKIDENEDNKYHGWFGYDKDLSVYYADIPDIENWHLWTIKDARGGDVLSFNDGHGNDCIELIKSITDKKIEFWFCLTNGNRYEVFDGITPYTNLVSREDATPATKGQRNQLEKAMTDAGYTFDFDKKELKEIEQKPTFDVEIPFGRDSELIEESLTIPDGCYAVIEDNKVVIRKGEQKPIIDNKDAEKAAEEYRNFRISCGIKDPVMLNEIEEAYYEGAIRKTVEWSEEDENMIESIDALCDDKIRFTEFKDVKENAYKIKNWLESLKERYTWKPSDEQMYNLLEAAHCDCAFFNMEILKGLYDDLKNLREE